jgi:hypothetical protein
MASASTFLPSGITHTYNPHPMRPEITGCIEMSIIVTILSLAGNPGYKIPANGTAGFYILRFRKE